MATTAGGLPYVESSDLVSGYPAVSLALAEELDDQLALKAPLASPTFTGTVTLTGATVVGLSSGALQYVAGSTFTTSSGINVNTCFTSTFDHYMIRITIDASSANCDLYLRWRASGTDSSSNVYGSTWQGYNTSAGSEAGQTNLVAQHTIAKHFSGYTGYVVLDVFDPVPSTYTMYKGFNVRQTSTNERGFLDVGGVHQNAASYDGFSLIPSTGTITGEYKIYGYSLT